MRGTRLAFRSSSAVMGRASGSAIAAASISASVIGRMGVYGNGSPVPSRTSSTTVPSDRIFAVVVVVLMFFRPPGRDQPGLKSTAEQLLEKILLSGLSPMLLSRNTSVGDVRRRHRRAAAVTGRRGLRRFIGLRPAALRRRGRGSRDFLCPARKWPCKQARQRGPAIVVR